MLTSKWEEKKKTEAAWRRGQERETEREVLVQTRSKACKLYFFFLFVSLNFRQRKMDSQLLIPISNSNISLPKSFSSAYTIVSFLHLLSFLSRCSATCKSWFSLVSFFLSFFLSFLSFLGKQVCFNCFLLKRHVIQLCNIPCNSFFFHGRYMLFVVLIMNTQILIGSLILCFFVSFFLGQ